MVARALKHFFFVGIVFALGVGWALTILVNTFLGYAMEALLRRPPEDLYWGALLLTAVSISLIMVATAVGSRVFRARVVRQGISASSLTISSTLFLGVVLAFVLPELSNVMNRLMTNMSYTYRHQGGAWLMLSLPLLRLIGLPLMYVLIGRRVLTASPHAGPALAMHDVGTGGSSRGGGGGVESL